MKKNHVGRPTNEEVRKRKISILVKMIVIAVLVVVGILAIINVNMDNLMGAYIGCHIECESNEWNPDNNKEVCYKKNVSQSSVDAYMLADAEIENNPNVIDSSDYQIMANDIKNNTKLDERKKLVYDLNRDGVINQEDLTKLEEAFSNYNTTGISPNLGYVCPKLEETKEEDDLGQTIITRVEYKNNGTKCDVETTVRIEIPGKKVCSGGMLTGKGRPSKSNNSYKKSDYSSTGYPSKKSSSSSSKKKKTSSKAKKVSIYKSNNGSYKPKKGDIIFLSFKSSYLATHVGIVYSVSHGKVTVLSGNAACFEGCKNAGKKNCKNRCKDDLFYLQNSIVHIDHYKQSSKKITGYIDMTKVTSSAKAKSLAELAYLEINKKRKGKYYFQHSNTWKNEHIGGYNYDWCTTFMAWVLEQGKVNPKKQVGWNRGCTAWVGSAKKIKK